MSLLLDGDMEDGSTQRLEHMFHQHMNLSNESNNSTSSDDKSRSSTQSVVAPASSIKYSISQHYTHTAHVAPPVQTVQPSKAETASRTLIQNGISPASLLRSQLLFFEEAEDDQRSRLIQLWRIVPPTYARNGGQELADRLGEYQTTNLAQEEELAWLRKQREDSRSIHNDTSNKGFQHANGTFNDAYAHPQASGISLENETQDQEML